MRDPLTKGHLVLDPQTAPTIRKIYDLALNGWGCMRIAKQLMEEKIPITRVKSNTACDVNYYSWGAQESAISCGILFIRAHIWFADTPKRNRSGTVDTIPRKGLGGHRGLP